MKVLKAISKIRGFGLIEVLVATAVSAIVALTLAALMSQMSSVSNFFWSKTDYDDIYRSVQLLLLNDTYCPQALHDASGNVITFNPDSTPQTPVNNIFMVNLNPPPAGQILLQVGQPYTNRLTISNVFLQEHTAGVGRGTITTSAGTFNSYIADLNIAVKSPAGVGTIAVKPITLTVGVDPATFQIKTCFAPTSNAALCAVLNATLDSSTGQCVIPPCPPTDPTAYANAVAACTPSSATNGCTTPVFFLAFTTSAHPICQCVVSCTGQTGAPGPPGPTITTPAPAPAPPYYPVYGGY